MAIYIFLMYLSVHEHRSCSQVLATIMNMRLQEAWTCRYLYGRKENPLGVCPGVVELGHVVTLFSVLLETATLISTIAVTVCIPTSDVSGFHFPHVLTNTYCHVFNDSYFDWGEVVL